MVRLEARAANAEGSGEVRIRDLVRASLRMRPDRIVVGEVRSGEALDMLQAMNTGHEGSLSTCHANGPVEALRRLETMVLMGDVDLPHAVVREQVATAVDLVVHVGRATSTAVGSSTSPRSVGSTHGGLEVRSLVDGDVSSRCPERPVRVVGGRRPSTPSGSSRDARRWFVRSSSVVARSAWSDRSPAAAARGAAAASAPPARAPAGPCSGAGASTPASTRLAHLERLGSAVRRLGGRGRGPTGIGDSSTRACSRPWPGRCGRGRR